MASFSFSFLLLSLLNNLLWLAYAQKIEDSNVGIPAMAGKCGLIESNFVFIDVYRHGHRGHADRAIFIGEKFAQLNYRLLHPRIDQRDLLQQHRASVPRRLRSLLLLHLNVHIDARTNSTSDPREGPQVHQLADVHCRCHQRSNLGGLCSTEERHPAVHDKFTRLLLHVHQPHLLYVGEPHDPHQLHPDAHILLLACVPRRRFFQTTDDGCW